MKSRFKFRRRMNAAMMNVYHSDDESNAISISSWPLFWFVAGDAAVVFLVSLRKLPVETLCSWLTLEAVEVDCDLVIRGTLRGTCTGGSRAAGIDASPTSDSWSEISLRWFPLAMFCPIARWKPSGCPHACAKYRKDSCEFPVRIRISIKSISNSHGSKGVCSRVGKYPREARSSARCQPGSLPWSYPDLRNATRGIIAPAWGSHAMLEEIAWLYVVTPPRDVGGDDE